MNKVTKNTIALICVMMAVIIVAGVSSVITLSATRVNANAEIIFGGNKELEERFSRLNEVYEILMSEYYIEPDSDKLIQGAIDGMLASLDDPYTFYYTPEEMSESTEQHEGVYHGIGVMVSSNKDGQLTVVRVFKNSPAQEAGLHPRDVILAVDGTSVSAENTEKMNTAVALVKGIEGTSVNLTILRNGEEMNISVKRGSVSINRVEYYILDGNVGYLVLYEFFGDAVSGVKEALREFEKANVEGIIFDVRSNTGGELNTCLGITDLFVPEGLIMYTQDRYGNKQSYHSNEYTYGKPLVVLIDGMTASASEVFSAAVQDYGTGTIIGTNSFGKGIVQAVIPFTADGAGMQLTTDQYFTPNGRYIHGIGVQPDIVVELQEDYDPTIYTPDMDNDNQLKAAYDEILRMIGEAR